MNDQIEQAARLAAGEIAYKNLNPVQIAAIISRHLSNQWVKVTERLPERHVWVLAFSKESDWVLATFNGAGSWEGDGYCEESSRSPYYADITHWMPLPAPPSASTQGESE